MRKANACFVALLTLGFSAAQVSAQMPSRLSLDLSIGRGFGSAEGEYRDNSAGITADILAAMRLRPLARGGLVAALGTGIHGTGAVTLVCIAHPDGGCVPSFPQFNVFSAALGWETSGGTLRGLVGPAVVHADGTAAAAVGRVDVAVPLVARLWLTASARGLVIPDYRGDAFRLGNLSIGVRLR